MNKPCSFEIFDTDCTTQWKHLHAEKGWIIEEHIRTILQTESLYELFKRQCSVLQVSDLERMQWIRGHLTTYLIKSGRVRHVISTLLSGYIRNIESYLCRMVSSEVCSIIFTYFESIVPSTPMFTLNDASDASAIVRYECPVYFWDKQFDTKYQIKVSPHAWLPIITSNTENTLHSLRNGWQYRCKVRAKNAFGQSAWSESAQILPLRKPEKPTHLECVSGYHCITIYWHSMDDMTDDSILGHYSIISDPVTTNRKTKRKNKVEFTGLDNNQLYRFKVIATNKNFSIESEWSAFFKPTCNRDRESYKRGKSLVIDKYMKIRRKKTIADRRRMKEISQLSNVI
eukprot:173367_1